MNVNGIFVNDEDFESLLNDIEEHVKKFDHFTDFSNWYAGITDNSENTEANLKNITRVMHFGKWDFNSKLNAVFFRDYLRSEMNFMSNIETHVSEQQPMTDWYKINSETIDKEVSSDSRYLFIFKNR